MQKPKLKWSAREIREFIETEFPQALAAGYKVERLEPRRVTVRLPVTTGHLRPGGSVSGPALMGLVDFTCYVVLLAHHGAAARLAVTTGLNMSFLRKAGLEDVICAAELLKHGRTLSVADCRIATADGRLIAHAEATYFMPEAAQG
ncbi:MAG TPA: PaaI family thioesterase [Hyphomicrobiales bacterium]|nr:PaaI family thioesterase [Hyphomicrobiales bacterium]